MTLRFTLQVELQVNYWRPGGKIIYIVRRKICQLEGNSKTKSFLLCFLECSFLKFWLYSHLNRFARH